MVNQLVTDNILPKKIGEQIKELRRIRNTSVHSNEVPNAEVFSKFKKLSEIGEDINKIVTSIFNRYNCRLV